MSTIGGIIFRSRGLRGLISSHLFVYVLKIKVLQIRSSKVLDKVSPQELKSFEVPTKEYSIVLFSLLKTLNGLSSNGLDLFFGCLELLVFFHRQLSLSHEVVPYDLNLLLQSVGFIHGGKQVFFQL